MATANRNKRVCPVVGSVILDNIFRKWVHNPEKLLSSYVKEGMTVLDVGCGPGMFSVAMAGMVGKTGKVIAADLQEGMLDKVRKKIAGTEFERRIELHKSEEDIIGVLEKVDFVLAFYMVHEVPNQEKFFQEIRSILNPDGKMFVIEPKFHVSELEFEQTLIAAKKTGLRKIKYEKVFSSRAALLGND